MGSVFSPYYAWARGRRPADPANFCAINVALYSKRRNRWAMTERGRARVARTPETFAVGPSTLTWDGESLTIEIDEVAVPVPRRIRGRVRVYPRSRTDTAHPIDTHGRHHWWPIAPRARVELDMRQPALSWRGRGYLDHNRGDEPLEAGFKHWTWSRADLSDGRAAVLYDITRADGSETSLALRFAADGAAEAIDPPPVAPLPTTGWRIPRHTRGDPGASTHVAATLEDTPFYARSVVATRWLDNPVMAVHESLSLTRFRSPLVRAMLPFRMPRKRA